jgi:hypothetical protein
MDPDTRPLATISDVARACAISPPQVLRIAERGDIPILRISPRCVRFVPSQVEAALGLPPGLIQCGKDAKSEPPSAAMRHKRQNWR